MLGLDEACKSSVGFRGVQGCLTSGFTQRLAVAVQGARYKVHDVLDQDKAIYDADVAAMWDTAEKFDPKTERLFRYLQVCATTLFGI